MAFRFKNIFTKSHDHHSNSDKDHEHHLLPVSLYYKIFGLLLAMIFLNMGIAHLPLPGAWMTFLLVSVSVVQTILVILFFMELIHEDKFYLFVFGSAILFMILFFAMTITELGGRGAVDGHEDIHYMRAVDLNGNYAPAGPENTRPKKEESSAAKKE